MKSCREMKRGAVGAVVLALLVLPPGAASSKPATLKGTLTGVHLPKPGAGIASVRAVRLRDAVVVAADYTSKGGSWSLESPAGRYALLAAVVAFKGKPTIDRALALVRARAGRTRTVRLRLKTKHKRKHLHARLRAAVHPGFGDVDVDYPAIWVHHFRVESQDPQLAVLGKGVADMLITDLSDIHALEPDCRAVVVERERINDLLSEREMQKLPGFDPGSRVQRGHIIRDNSSVTGTVAASGGQMTLTATYTNRRTGKSGTVSVHGHSGDFFKLEQELFRKLASVICSPPLPRRWTGTVKGTEHQTGGAIDITDSWTAHVTFTRYTRRSNYAAYSSTGNIDYTTSGTINGCTMGGSGSHAIHPLDGTLEITVPPGNQINFHMYSDAERGFDGQGHQVTTTCPDSPPSTGDWAVYVPWVDTHGYTQAPAGTQTLSGSYSDGQPGDVTTWTWSLTADNAPAARSAP